MFWVIRFTDRETQQDTEMVVEAAGRAAAETMALKRGIPLDFVGEASESDIAAARERKLLWKYTPDRPRFSVFGQPASAAHVAFLMLCGIWTMLAVLQNAHVYLFSHLHVAKLF